MAAIFASAIRAIEGSAMRPGRDALVDWARRTDVNEANRKKAKAARSNIVGGRLQPVPWIGQHPKEEHASTSIGGCASFHGEVNSAADYSARDSCNWSSKAPSRCPGV